MTDHSGSVFFVASARGTKTRLLILDPQRPAGGNLTGETGAYAGYWPSDKMETRRGEVVIILILSPRRRGRGIGRPNPASRGERQMSALGRVW